LLLQTLIFPTVLSAVEIKVAVASNFRHTMKILVQQYENGSENHIKLIAASSGKLFAQISNGAPFDVFYSADTERPRRLEQEQLVVGNSRFTYAIGRLILLSSAENFSDSKGSILQSDDFNHLAIANPRHAPYGLAAQQVLQNLELWTALERKIVMGESISQAFQFVDSGNADLGFVSWSQILQSPHPVAQPFWLVPAELHAPINQQAVLLSDKPAALDFFQFTAGEIALKIISENGYSVP
jgi:molybdate transport system substrate-binding protein